MIDVPIFTPQRLISSLTEWARKVANEHNSLATGHIQSVYSATVAPTTGQHHKGDYVRNSAPAEAGAGTQKYVITGWVCSVSGEPGTWLECRSLTGN